ncbi:LysR family transcriptional regulator [Sinorhizobium fredii]|uniref:LysR family transcriptional regulator n=1 Tax=Rhizobium fredii TaxID=380 RepID=UPI001FCBD43B|nr:LysR family transcriptional regulator [Sinorhizobium fredii]
MRTEHPAIDGSLASDLWIFHVVAQSRTFEEASHSLAITQSAVSQRMARLEARLGTKLFERKGRQARLTPNGQLLLQGTTTGFDAIVPTVQAIRSGSKSQNIRVSCVPSLALEWLTPRLGGFLKLYPDCNVEIFGDVAALDHRQMAGQNIDVCIRYGPKRQCIGPVLLCVDEPCFPVGSPDVVRQLSKATREFGTVTLLHDTAPWDGASKPDEEWAIWLKENPAPWLNELKRRDLHFNLAQLAYRAAMDGIGLAIGRARLVNRHLYSGKLERLPNAKSSQFSITVQTAGSAVPAKLNVFLEWLRYELEEDLHVGAV